VRLRGLGRLRRAWDRRWWKGKPPVIPVVREPLPGELWGITSFFNPARYQNKLENLGLFAERARSQGLKLLVIELAFGDSPFEVPDSLADRVERRRTTSVLWQKERLLNIGADLLPRECDKVAWLDCDLVFENDDWVRETAGLLESYCAVQPFDTAVWLSRGATTAPPTRKLKRGYGENQYLRGMGYALSRHRDRRRAFQYYMEHGHLGFAWAIRRWIQQKHGFYDAQVLGNGDFVMGHAMYGDEDFWNGDNWQCSRLSEPMLRHIEAWGRPFHEDVRGSVYYVEGRVLHLWHGKQEDRQYDSRLDVLKASDFDPEIDLALDENECWVWASNRPELHQWAEGYFHSRKEE
jgi:hypothetical protein